jgi:hypothetical protein
VPVMTRATTTPAHAGRPARGKATARSPRLLVHTARQHADEPWPRLARRQAPLFATTCWRRRLTVFFSGAESRGIRSVVDPHGLGVARTLGRSHTLQGKRDSRSSFARHDQRSVGARIFGGTFGKVLSFAVARKDREPGLDLGQPKGNTSPL